MTAGEPSRPSTAARAEEVLPEEVLIVDDSVVVRRLLTRLISADPRFSVSGAVANGEHALEFVSTQPVDLILLDMHLPGMDGLTLLPKLLAGARRPRVIMLSGACREGSETALRAREMGASDIISKPNAGHFSPGFAGFLLDRLAGAMPLAERSHLPQPVDQMTVRPLGAKMIRVIGIGGSTGGISGLTTLVTGLRMPAPPPVLITQHLPANFQPLFAEQLRRITRLPVVIAEDGLEVRAGTIHLASGRAHLSLALNSRGAVIVKRSTESCLHGGFPAVDPMFAAMARIYGSGACGVILSGMGRDGLAGARAIVEAGGWIIAQDHDSSAVWGMPGAVAKAGLASAILPPGAMLDMILQHLRVSA